MFALGILFFLIFLILGQVLVLTIAQEGEGLCLCSETRVYLGEGRVGRVTEAKVGLLPSARVTCPDRVSMSASSCLSVFPPRGEICLQGLLASAEEELGVNC